MEQDHHTGSMTTQQLQEWLVAWVIRTTGLPAEEITVDKPMQSFGLSSRDVVVLSGELENLMDIQLDATIALVGGGGLWCVLRAHGSRLARGRTARN